MFLFLGSNHSTLINFILKMTYKVFAPQQMNQTFVAAFNSGQIDNLLMLYEPDAVLVRSDGSLVRGTDQIRDELSKLLSMGIRSEGQNQFAITYGNTALPRANFTITLLSEDGQETFISGSSWEVVSQQPSGCWLYIIDHPFGANANQ
jgi:ketosteroid isomerase-like protein